MNTIMWHNKARKQIKKIPAKIRETIFEKIDQLSFFPECNGVDITQLKNHKFDLRMRVGRYRILFDYYNIIKIIEIQEIKKRDERTY